MTDEPEESEKIDRKEKAGTWTKFAITTLLAVIGFVVGLIEYGASNFYSVRKPFLEMQTDLCKSAAEAAARVATTTDEIAWHKALNDFWMLYWGPLIIVEDVDLQKRDLAETSEKAESNLDRKRDALKDNLENSKTPVTDSMILFALQVDKLTRLPNLTLLHRLLYRRRHCRSRMLVRKLSAWFGISEFGGVSPSGFGGAGNGRRSRPSLPRSVVHRR